MCLIALASSSVSYFNFISDITLSNGQTHIAEGQSTADCNDRHKCSLQERGASRAWHLQPTLQQCIRYAQI